MFVASEPFGIPAFRITVRILKRLVERDLLTSAEAEAIIEEAWQQADFLLSGDNKDLSHAILELLKSEIQQIKPDERVVARPYIRAES